MDEVEGRRVVNRKVYALLTALACAFCGASAHAEEWSRGEAETSDAQGEAAGTNPQKSIVVTGSRLRGEALYGTLPVVTLGSAYVRDRNLSHFADALNEMPGIRGSVTPEGAQSSYGQGVNFINAYGLGSNRTLTLVDGKRFVSSNGPTVFAKAGPGTQVDLNAIPTILVDRVERLSIGGASAYGSDAIAGTINVILKHDLEGQEIEALSGVTGGGDNFRWKIAAAGGRNFANGRANLTFAISYDRTAGVSSTQIPAYRANLGSAPNPCTTYQPGLCTPFGTVAALGLAGRTPANDGRVNPNIGFNGSATDGYPGSILVRDFGLAAVATGGVLSSGPGAYSYRFAADGSLVPYRQGTLFSAPLSGSLATASLSSGGDGLKLFDYVGVTSRIERFNAAAFITYQLTDRLTLFSETIHYHGKADEPVDLPSFNAVLFQGVSGALTFRTDNPFLSGQARQQLAELGYGATFQLSRANTDLADRSGSSDSKLYRAIAGLRGDLSLGGRDYDFELSLNYGRSDFTDHGQEIDEQRFVNAVNVALMSGEIVCSTAPTVTGLPSGMAPIADPACKPLNLFGNGAPSPEALDYVLRETTAKSRLEQIVVNANIGGSPFELFGKPISFNIGYEHRQETARFRPDAFLALGLGRQVAIEPVSGRYNLDEIFGETLVPLIGPDDNAVLSKLVAFGRVRHVESSANGRFTAWSTGGSFAPIGDVELRGNFGIM